MGALIGAWLLSGTVPAIIYAGLSTISPKYFLVTAVLLCMATSLATGTSWGTMGTMGVAMMGVGAGLDVSPAITAGAVISGAYFGDKLSPLSDSTNLAPAVCGSTLIEHMQRMLWTTVPAILIALLAFFLIGLFGGGHDGASTDQAQVEAIRQGLLAQFNISGWAVLPIIVVVALLALRLPAYLAIFAGGLAGALLAIPLQGASLTQGLNVMYSGFSVETGIDNLNGLLNRGGMSHMFELALLFVLAVSLGGVLEGTGVVGALVKPVLPRLSSPRRVTLSAIPMVLVTLVIGASFSFAAVVTATIMRPLYDQFDLEPKNLSRTIEDIGTVNDPTFPWSSGALYASGVLGVATLDYLPFMFFMMASVALSILYAATGFTITTRRDPVVRLPAFLGGSRAPALARAPRG
ncbi:Na+/H+ antiporter NhaC [Pseudooceanicola sp. CBS1P-1]|uniref:Na+/H+ antiporter NhaC n=1 Tax=Pseudooceanicola albus TaxID=2692189 RepID=A0A6L7G1Z4_9RHOB|nr:MULTISPECIES: Na+/H+ antiporter NhaC [Pseudooceanicola]MBT9383605.1 Na+/H+ antiporter NhaC [Pseudooceanicola endophyticus]MXN17460.1 Na+/H+ antiporter NhaC [Pseudooceanicola albus]